MPVLGTICKHGYMIPVDRENKVSKENIGAIRNALKILKQGGIIDIFMQGGIGRSDFTKSPIDLARHTGATILPIYLSQKTLLRIGSEAGGIGRYAVSIGRPLSHEELIDTPAMSGVAKLWNKVLELQQSC